MPRCAGSGPHIRHRTSLNHTNPATAPLHLPLGAEVRTSRSHSYFWTTRGRCTPSSPPTPHPVLQPGSTDGSFSLHKHASASITRGPTHVPSTSIVNRSIAAVFRPTHRTSQPPSLVSKFGRAPSSLSQGRPPSILALCKMRYATTNPARKSLFLLLLLWR